MNMQDIHIFHGGIPTYPELHTEVYVDRGYTRMKIATILRLNSKAGWQRLLVCDTFESPCDNPNVDFRVVCFRKFTISVYEIMLVDPDNLVDNGKPLFGLDADQRSEQERLRDQQYAFDKCHQPQNLVIRKI
jgi:hypothetical protein